MRSGAGISGRVPAAQFRLRSTSKDIGCFFCNSRQKVGHIPGETGVAVALCQKRMIDAKGIAVYKMLSSAAEFSVWIVISSAEWNFSSY